MKRILYFWGELKSTFWFIPVLIMIFFIALALVLIYVDSIVDYDTGPVTQYFLTANPDSARRIVSIISAAMIGVAGTVFSITLVALSLASSQFGPRLLKNYMYDRLNQVVLGTYVSTFIYCLIVLNSIRGVEKFTFIPSISVLVAIAVALANIILLLVFIHHIAVGIQADKVISGVYKELDSSLKALFEEEKEKGEDQNGTEDEQKIKERLPYKKRLIVHKGGYIQLIDYDKFINVASEFDGIVEIYHRPGSYLVDGQEMGIFYAGNPLEQETLDKCKSFYVMGSVRTRYQDAEYAIHQMVEIASRALSPGINDPYTAITCIDKLTSGICYLTGAKFPSRYRYDDKGNLRVMVKVLSFEGIVDASLNQIRQYGKSMPAVMVRLMESLATINNFARDENQKAVVRNHARLVMNMAEKSFDEPDDINDLVQRYNQIETS